MAKVSWKAAFWILVLFALLLRLFLLPYAKFENETARDIVVSKRIVETGDWPLHGVLAETDADSQQQSFGPAYYYLIASFLLFNKSPYAAISLVAVLSIVSCIICFYLTKRYFGEKFAFWTSALFVLSPWFFYFVSLNLMTPSVLVPFSMILFYSLMRIVVDGEDKHLALAAVTSAIMLQIHLSSLLPIASAFVVILISRGKALFSKKIILPISLFLLLMAPYIVNSYQHDSWSSVFGFLQNRYESTRLENIRDSLGIPFMFTTAYFGKYLLGSESVFQSRLAGYSFLMLDILIALATLLGFFIVFLRALDGTISNHERKRDLVVLAWFAVPILIVLLAGKNVSPHYLLVVYPAQFIFLSTFIEEISKHLNLESTILSLAAALIYVMFIIVFWNFLSESRGTDEIYGIPIGAKIDVLEYLRTNSIDKILFYKYVKGEYKLLIETKYPEIDAGSISEIRNNQTGYILLDMYSRGNFAERQMKESEIEIIKRLKTTKIGKIEVVKLG